MEYDSAKQHNKKRKLAQETHVSKKKSIIGLDKIDKTSSKKGTTTLQKSSYLSKKGEKRRPLNQLKKSEKHRKKEETTRDMIMESKKRGEEIKSSLLKVVESYVMTNNEENLSKTLISQDMIDLMHKIDFNLHFTTVYDYLNEFKFLMKKKYDDKFDTFLKILDFAITSSTRKFSSLEIAVSIFAMGLRCYDAKDDEEFMKILETFYKKLEENGVHQRLHEDILSINVDFSKSLKIWWNVFHEEFNKLSELSLQKNKFLWE